MLTDTHAHLDFPEFAPDLEAVLARAQAAGVRRIISIGTTLQSSRNAVELAQRYPMVFATVGIHPNAAAEAPPDFVEQLRDLARAPKVVALGEIGLDYFRLPSRIAPTQPPEEVLGTGPRSPANPDPRDLAIQGTQARVFHQQLELAVELGLNVVIHEREAWEDTVTQLASYQGRLRAVFHCFGKSPQQAQLLLAQNHLVSFTGIISFKNAAIVQETARLLPPSSFMVETDCPFLAPVPHRGKRGEPAFTRLVAEQIAKLRQVPLEEIARQTEAVADAFFAFKREEPLKNS